MTTKANFVHIPDNILFSDNYAKQDHCCLARCLPRLDLSTADSNLAYSYNLINVYSLLTYFFFRKPLKVKSNLVASLG